MNYYRLSFKRVTTPNPAKPDLRHWDWFSLTVLAPNRSVAKDHGKHVASVENVDFVDAIRLLKVIGIVEFNKLKGCHKI